MRNYIFNLETTKNELHFEKSEYDSLTDEQKNRLKGAFLWSKRGNCWASRAKEPNLYRAKDVAKELGFTEEQREGSVLPTPSNSNANLNAPKRVLTGTTSTLRMLPNVVQICKRN